jgi:sulfopyruvate decarboxylase subunit beta
MVRSEILKSLIPVISDHFVVCNIGLPSQELHMLDDQRTNFYMLGTMGLASSIGLGVALAQKQKIIAIDGDGSVLTNMGTLPTIANNVADNFILLIIDNGSYGSQAALDSNRMTIIVCKCESGNIKVPVIQMDPVVIRDRFMKELESRNG